MAIIVNTVNKSLVHACGGAWKVVATIAGGGDPILLYRRRKCDKCGEVMGTVEIGYDKPIPSRPKKGSRYVLELE